MRMAIGLLSLMAAASLAACSQPGASAHVGAAAPGPVIYAAIGASETYGVGADDRYRQAWPQLFFNDALPASSTLFNLGIPAETTAAALKDEVPAAVAAHPDLVSVWLNVNDLVQGVPPSTYGQQLEQVVHALRRGGATRVLLANMPDLRQLPAYTACLSDAPAGGPACLIPAGLVPAPAQLGDLINAYNAQIASVASREGATLVDLYSDGAVLRQHPDWISSDGFHPNGAGYLAIAKAFEAAYARR